MRAPSLLPSATPLLLVSLGLFRRAKALCWAGLVVRWPASTALVGDTVMRAAEGWQVRVPIAALPSSQAIVVLSGMLVVSPGDAPLGEWSEAVDRVEAGMALLQAGKAPVLVCTGGWVPWSPGARPEGKILAERAVVLGVPRSHRLVTDKVTHTADVCEGLRHNTCGRLPGVDVQSPLRSESPVPERRARHTGQRAASTGSPAPPPHGYHRSFSTQQQASP